MTCPKCNAEVPDTTRFCPECGEPQTAVAKSLVRTKTPSWAILLAFLSFGLVAYIAVHLVNDFQKDDAAAIKPRAAVVGTSTEPVLPPQPPPPQPHAVPIGNGALVVNATGYSWYAVTVPSGVSTVSITGHFTASGGAGNDIIAYVFDEDGFVNFKNNHPARTFYNSGKVTQAAIGTVLPAFSSTYYLVFDNRYSLLTPKAVQFNATLNYMQ